MPASPSRIKTEHRARRAAARSGGSVPSEWGPVIAQTADFEPEDDGELLEWMGRQVTGLSAWAEALVDFYDHATNTIGIDPTASAMLHDVADAAAQAESRHATGAEAEIPDISEYSRGPQGLLPELGPPRAKEIATTSTSCSGVPRTGWPTAERIVNVQGPPAHPARHRGDPPPTNTRHTRLGTGAPGMREAMPSTASGGQGHDKKEPPATMESARKSNGHGPAIGIARGYPAMPRPPAGLLGLLASPEGTTASATVMAIGKKQDGRLGVPGRAEGPGLAELTGSGRPPVAAHRAA